LRFERRIAVTAPFEGLRVVDLSDRLAGAFAARLFGDLGADVILAERGKGYPLRHEPPFLDDRPGTERSHLHAYITWNKRSVAVDDPRDLADLVASADEVVTDADPIAGAWFAGALASLPAGAVHVSITPHGSAWLLPALAAACLRSSGRSWRVTRPPHSDRFFGLSFALADGPSTCWLQHWGRGQRALESYEPRRAPPAVGRTQGDPATLWFRVHCAPQAGPMAPP
jgi:hypothetical protein